MSTHRWRFVGVLVGLLLVLSGCGGDDHGGNGGDHTAPAVRIAFPPADTTVAGSVTIFAEATDNLAVSHIDFYIDAQKRHTDSTMPYTYDWDCSPLPDSTAHSISAKAFDAAGNVGASDTVTVLVRSVHTIQKVIDCSPSIGGGGDMISRGFYVTPVPPGQLAKVILYVATHVAGQYTLLLTARRDTYDGALIGTGTAVVELSDSAYASREATFLFSLPVINADSVVTFAIQLVSGPSQVVTYSTADCVGDCQATCPIIETEGTTAPLDTFRRFGMAAKVYVQM